MFSRKPKNLEELSDVLRRAQKDGLLSQHMLQLLLSIIKAKATTVEEIMVPRVDTITVRASQTLRQVIEEYTQHGYSKVPVLSDEGEDVVGILHIKEMIKFLDRLDTTTAKDLAIPATFVPQTQQVLDTLRDFQRDKVSIALVVDEYGSLVGLVTTEDVLEELVGDIWEEYDKEEFTHRRLPDGSFLFNARVDLEEASAVLECVLDSEEVSSLGGLVIEKLGRVPKKGEFVDVNGVRIQVLDATPQRVKLLKVMKRDKQEKGD